MISAPLDKESFFFASKGDAAYRDLIIDRASQLVFSLAGPSDTATAISQGADYYIEYGFSFADQLILRNSRTPPLTWIPSGRALTCNGSECSEMKAGFLRDGRSR